jgi:formylglycine-generating enzyme required for sulfatase activity
MKFVWCPPGTFLMGSPSYEPNRGGEESQHRVTLTQGFWMGVTPVTQAQWQAVIGSNPSHFKGDDRPVEQVSWDDCEEFCRKLCELDGGRYRLPREAEWEYACRAGTTTPFHCGAIISRDQANFDGRWVYRGEYLQRTTPVDSFPANPWGLRDVHGNVREWCQDWYGPYPPSDILNDPEGPRRGDARVLRGGSWNDAHWGCRSAARFRVAPNVRARDSGFRIVRLLNIRCEQEEATTRIGAQPGEVITNPGLPTDTTPVVPAAPRSSPAPTAEKVLTNSIGMRLVLIPAGTFLMGSPAVVGHDDAEEPPHEVIISRPFFLGVFPVRQAQYEQVMGTNPSWFSAHGNYMLRNQDTQSFPVENVSWQDTVAFCRKLSEMPEEMLHRRVYRLPTEAEWEYACRGGESSFAPFAYGYSLSSLQANFDGNYPYGSAAGGPYLERTTSVGSYEPNAFGLYDMHGNVWEWCLDWFDASYYARSPKNDPMHGQGPPEKDPHGPQSGEGRVLREVPDPYSAFRIRATSSATALVPSKPRVLRGGSWIDAGWNTRSASRYWNAPSNRQYNFGFRIALTVAAPGSLLTAPACLPGGL